MRSAGAGGGPSPAGGGRPRERRAAEGTAGGGRSRTSTTVSTTSAVVIAAILATGASWRLGMLALILAALVGAALLLAPLVARHGGFLLDRATAASLRWRRGRDDRAARRAPDRLRGLGAELSLVLLFLGAAVGGVWLPLGALEAVVGGGPWGAVDVEAGYAAPAGRSTRGAHTR